MLKVSGVEQGPLAVMERTVPNQSLSWGKVSPNENTNNELNVINSNSQCSPEKLKKSVETLNNTMRTYNTKLRFELHEKSGEYMVKVLKEGDGTLIREIPPEKVLDMVAYFKEKLGIIIDKFI